MNSSRVFELAGVWIEIKLNSKRDWRWRKPRNIKMELGHAIVEIYHGEKAAQAAGEHFKPFTNAAKCPREWGSDHARREVEYCGFDI
jgi:hypothetical protein